MLGIDMFFFSSRRRHTRYWRDWSSDVCSSDLPLPPEQACLPWHPPGLVAGVDEAGRGPLAGPVVAAAVILDDLNPIEGLNDSKKLTAARREALYDEIRAKALCCSIAEASVEEIDRLNILQ